MKIVGYGLRPCPSGTRIHDYKEIEKIADNLGHPTWRAPPQIDISKEGVSIDISAEFNQTIH